jgi:hypothetical protein
MIGLYRDLNSIEAFVGFEDWEKAAKRGIGIHDEAQRRKAVSSEGLWGNFGVHADQLKIAIRGKDQGGCKESLTSLRADLARIVGPEV